MKNILLFICICFSSTALAQYKPAMKDSTFLDSIITKYNLEIDSLYKNKKTISKIKARKIARDTSISRHGYSVIIRQMPFHINNYFNYWIVIGRIYVRRHGGRLFLIINSETGVIEKMYHGK